MSGEQFGNLFTQGITNGILTGLIIFIKAGWPYILIMVALATLEIVIKRRRRKKH